MRGARARRTDPAACLVVLLAFGLRLHSLGVRAFGSATGRLPAVSSLLVGGSHSDADTGLSLGERIVPGTEEVVAQ